MVVVFERRAEANATVARSNYYEETGAPSNGDHLLLILPDLDNAVKAGIFKPSPFEDFNCSSKWCRWEDYSSVAWCSSCTDISDQLSITNNSFSVSDADFWNLTTALPDNGLAVNWTSPSLTQQLATMGQSYPWEASDIETYTNPIAVSLDFITGTKPSGPSDPTTSQPWSDCTGTPSDTSSWRCEGYGASRCELFPCVKTYHTSVDAGEFSEDVVDDSTNWGGNMDLNQNLTMLDAKCLNSTLNDTWIPILATLGYRIKPEDRWIGFNHSSFVATMEQHGRRVENATAVQACVYTLQHDFLNSINDYFVKLFAGSVYGTSRRTDGPQQLSGNQIVLDVFDHGKVDLGNVTELFYNVSEALTTYIRSNGNALSENSTVGDNDFDQVCIGARWPYVAFPAGMVLMTLLFLLAVMVKTRPVGDRPEIYKSSPLALIFLGMMQQDESESEPADRQATRDLSTMRQRARRTKVDVRGTLRANTADYSTSWIS